VRYVKVTGDGHGGSRFEDVDVPQTAAPFAENVPPLLVSAPVEATAVVFVTSPDDIRETDPQLPHPAPSKRFLVVLEGELEIETTDGERRSFVPGSVVLVEDLEGRGHITRVCGDGLASAMAVALTG
jgi:hypothetical protein